MSDQFLGEIRIFGCGYAPTGWALCNGQIMAISQNTALFSLIGTSYGGDGRVTFALPNLQGRIPVDQGQGSGLSPYVVGQMAGTTAVTLLSTEMAAHNHALNADKEVATSASPSGAIYMRGHFDDGTNTGLVQAYSTQRPAATMAINATLPAGSGAAHNNMMPYLTINYCIALTGFFPPRG